MKLLGPQFIFPTTACVVLCIYAGVYGALLMFAFAASGFGNEGLVFALALLALAATPFIAVVHLRRALHPNGVSQRRLVVMIAMMALPAAFWSWAFVNSVSTSYRFYLASFLGEFAIMGVPAILSIWVAVAFVLIWRRDRAIASSAV